MISSLGTPALGTVTLGPRTRAPRHGRGWLVAALLILAPTTGVVWADARESHKLGVEAIDAGRWADAERLFRAALAERSEERYNALLGRRYFPYFYLGVALAEQGDCRSALDAWQETRSQGKSTRDKDVAADLERRRQACNDRLAEIDRLHGELEELLAQADDSFATLGGLAARPILAARWQDSGGFGERQAAAQATLDTVRRQGAAAKVRQDLATLQSSEAEARRTLEAIGELISAARVELGDRTAANSRALEALEVTEARARRSLRSVAGLAPYPPQLARRVRAVETLLTEVGTAKEGGESQALAEVDERLQGALDQLRRASAGPPQALRTAVEAHLVGDALRVLEVLDEAGSFRDSRARAQGCLLRAAALHRRFVLDSAQVFEAEEALDEELLAEDSSTDDGTAEDSIAEDGTAEDSIAEDGTASQDSEGSSEELTVDAADPATTEDGELAEGFEEPPPPVLEEEVTTALRACAELEPAPDPSRRFFSPRFLDLYWNEVDAVAAERQAATDASE